MLAASSGTIRMVNQNVIVARGAHEAIHRFGELVVPHLCSVLRAGLLAGDCYRGHSSCSFSLIVSTRAILRIRRADKPRGTLWRFPAGNPRAERRPSRISCAPPKLAVS